ncbi:MAG: DNA cytosine methyltransferase [SAR202 cluster bacterium]|nr:DNA cytosine methyltransferase [SAR202 cluster bacterium]
MTDWLTIDLFCGAGGITEGFRQAGFRCIFANDNNLDSLKTFRRNHPNVEVTSAAVESLNPAAVRHSLALVRGELDCLVGGPPCQGFSINAPVRFQDDPRNKLIQQYLGFVEEFCPKTLVIENVPGLVSFQNGFVVRSILDDLAKLGYQFSAKILSAAHYGVPQERWRLIILGSRTEVPMDHPEPTHAAEGRANFTGGRSLTFKLAPVDTIRLAPAVTVEQALDDLPFLESGEGCEIVPYTKAAHSAYAVRMREDSDFIYHHVAGRIAAINIERLRHIKPGGSWRDLPIDLLPEGMKRARRSDHTKRYGRLRRDGLAGTVMTKMDPHWGAAFHYNQDRTLTVREAARLQSFPDSYRFSGSRGSQYRQVGNAVPVLMAKAVAESIGVTLDSMNSSTVSYA